MRRHSRYAAACIHEHMNTCAHVYENAALVRILPQKWRIFLRMYQGAKQPHQMSAYGTFVTYCATLKGLANTVGAAHTRVRHVAGVQIETPSAPLL